MSHIVEIKNEFSNIKFFKSKLNIWFWIITLFFNLLIWIYIYFKIKPQVEPIFLHYNIYFGIDLIGKWYRIYLFPLSGLLILIINIIFSSFVFKKEKVISNFICLITIAFQIIIFLSVFLIVQQNK